MDLSVNQIYKWFWDTGKKIDEDNCLAQQSEIKLPVEATGFGYRMKTVVQGRSGHGEFLTPQQIKTALKVSQDAEVEPNEFIELA
jgi:hypothetical protein